MRITNATGYMEHRDSIAMDWSKYMLSAYPESKYLYIPNLENDATEYVKKWDINVLVLSGGDDLGVYSKRDKTEYLLLEYALKMKIPIIAICRGMQLVHSFFGGILKQGNEEFAKLHKNTLHQIFVENTIREVNSFHKNLIVEESINQSFEIYARCTSDNTIEGIRNSQILAMMWHPERDSKVMEWNKLLIKNFL